MSFIKVCGQEVEEGAGAKVIRLFPTDSLRNFDPFVLFDHFFISPPAGFPEHPHRGFEIITLVLEGAIKHADSLGNSEIINSLGIQKITAGKGILHSELPAFNGITQGIQIWINLPKKFKKIDPGYQIVRSEQIPVIEDRGFKEYIIAGSGTKINLKTAVEYRLFEVCEGSAYRFTPQLGFNTILYLIEGEVTYGHIKLKKGQGLLLCGNSLDEIRCRTKAKGIVVSGNPLGEPIIHRGPFVD